MKSDNKDYRVNLKVRNNKILTAIEKVGGVTGQKWCTENNISYCTLNNLINMSISPINSHGDIIPTVEKLMIVTNSMLSDLFSEDQIYNPIEDNKFEFTSTLEQICSISQPNEELQKLIDNSLSQLSPRQALVLKARYGIDGEAKTLDRIASEQGVTKERICQIEANALRILRHPKHSKEMREYL